VCGRYSSYYTWREIWEFSGGLQLSVPSEDPLPAYNLAPTQAGWVLVGESESRALATQMRWGLIPAWARDAKIAYSTINARVETASSKPAFRSAWKSRRCLVPASGYFEWPGEGKQKQPYYIHATDAPVLMFGGLWERWSPKDGEAIETYSIVTMDAAGDLARLHDRMPLILPPDLHRDWIEGDGEQAAAIAQAAPVPALTWYAVGKAVGNVRNQGPQLIEPVDPLRSL
jgi:putative SOS response-associated peptidase YedK